MARGRHDTGRRRASGDLTDVAPAVPAAVSGADVVHMRPGTVTDAARGAGLIIVNALFHAQIIDFREKTCRWRIFRQVRLSRAMHGRKVLPRAFMHRVIHMNCG